jgi:hypothetical protein
MVAVPATSAHCRCADIILKFDALRNSKADQELEGSAAVDCLGLADS